MKEIKFLASFINGKLILSLVFSFFAALSSILLLATSAYLITSAAYQPPLYTLGLAITLVRTAGLFRAIFRYLERLTSHSSAFETEEKLRLKYYEKALKTLPMKEGRISENIFLNGVIKGAEILRDFFIRSFSPIILTFLLTITATLLLFPVINYYSFIIIFIWILHIILSLSLKENSVEKEIVENYRSIVADRIFGKTSLLFSNGINKVLSELNKKSELLSKTESNKKQRNIKLNFILQFIRDTSFIILFIVLFFANKENIINSVWLAVYALSILVIFEEFNTIFPAVIQGKNSIIYANDIIENDKKIISRKNIIYKNNEPILKVENLYFGYNKEEYILKNISFTLNTGEKIAILGESGAGKTTLLSLLLKLYEKNSGNIYINGESYDNLSSEDIRKNFAVLLQSTHIFNGTIKENIKFFCGKTPEIKIKKILQICNLNYDIDKNIGFDGDELSGGERTRLLTALALLNPAPILILDEPTLGLDKKNSEEIIKNIFGIFDKSIILITHDKNLIKYADKTITLP